MLKTPPKTTQNTHNNTPNTYDFSPILDGIFMILGYLLFASGILAISYLKKNPQALSKVKSYKLYSLGISISLLSASLIYTCSLFFKRAPLLYSVLILLLFWILSAALIFTFRNLFIDKDANIRITPRALKERVKKFDQLVPLLNDKSNIPIGISLRTNESFFLPVHLANHHVLICGATGVGKTSLLITMLKHCFKHNIPAIVIDPKGDLVDIDIVKNVAKDFSREDDLLVFSLSNPKKSCSYNAIKIGTPEQKKSKLMEGLDLEHEYYGAVASKYLGTLFDILDFLGKKDITLADLQNYLINENAKASLFEQLNEREDSEEVDNLLMKLNSLRQVSNKDIAGLCAQIESFSLREFHGALNPRQSRNKEVDLIDVLQNGKVAYFQMNVNAYGDLSSRLGKLIIQDIKLISNMFQSGQVEKKFEYAGIFVDEFGSFATRSFANIQKMIRSSGMGLRLFYQGMADLRDVSPAFENQVLGNSLIKIVLRQDVDEDVEKWSGMAGTIDSYIHSYQTETSLLGDNKTGTGNIHLGKKTKIEFDVFKNLGVGQAVVIDKGRQIQDLIQIWDSKNVKISDSKVNINSAVNVEISKPLVNSRTNKTNLLRDNYLSKEMKRVNF